MFGAHGPNFVKTMLRLAREKDEMRVVADQRGCPTWTVDLADALVAIVQRIFKDPSTLPWGAYHFCGEGETTWHGFAEEIIREGGRHERLKVVRVIPIETADYPTPARRPAYSVLDCRRIGEVFGIVPRSWRFGLAETVSQICETKNA
jgi:dTDP-4-dehydrorhamnose reductase